MPNLTHAAKVCCRTLQIAEPQALNLDKYYLPRVCRWWQILAPLVTSMLPQVCLCLPLFTSSLPFYTSFFTSFKPLPNRQSRTTVWNGLQGLGSCRTLKCGVLSDLPSGAGELLGNFENQANFLGSGQAISSRECESGVQTYFSSRVGIALPILPSKLLEFKGHKA